MGIKEIKELNHRFQIYVVGEFYELFDADKKETVFASRDRWRVVNKRREIIRGKKF